MREDGHMGRDDLFVGSSALHISWRARKHFWVYGVLFGRARHVMSGFQSRGLDVFWKDGTKR